MPIRFLFRGEAKDADNDGPLLRIVSSRYFDLRSYHARRLQSLRSNPMTVLSIRHY